MHRVPKGFAIALSTIVIGATVYAVVSSVRSPTIITAAPAVKVALATVQRSAIAQVLTGVGELEAARQVRVAAEVGGRVTRIAFESGQRIEAGQLLVQLNDAPEQAELIRLQAQWRNAQAVYTRTRKLVTENVAAQEQLDHALATRDMASGELQRIRASIAQKAVRAPFSGVLGIRQANQGQYLNVADAIVNLVDAQTLYVNFSLDEQTSPHLKVGQSVQLAIDAYPGRTFIAKINAIDPLIARSRMVRAQATLTNPDDELRAGMYAGIRVERQPASEALTVPETAVTYTAYGETVFIAQRDDKHALTVTRVAVKVGARHGGRVEIETGLSPSDQVVTSGQLKLSDGMAVEAVSEDTLAPTQATSRSGT